MSNIAHVGQGAKNWSKLWTFKLKELDRSSQNHSIHLEKRIILIPKKSNIVQKEWPNYVNLKSLRPRGRGKYWEFRLQL